MCKLGGTIDGPTKFILVLICTGRSIGFDGIPGSEKVIRLLDLFGILLRFGQSLEHVGNTWASLPKSSIAYLGGRVFEILKSSLPIQIGVDRIQEFDSSRLVEGDRIQT